MTVATIARPGRRTPTQFNVLPKALKIKVAGVDIPLEQASAGEPIDRFVHKDIVTGDKHAYITADHHFWRVHEGRDGLAMTPLFRVRPEEREFVHKLSRELAKRH